MPLPANIRKKSEIYNENVTKRGNVKKSLNPSVDSKFNEMKREENARKAGIKSQRALTKTQKNVVLVMFVILVGSVLASIFSPLFSSSRRPPVRKTTPNPNSGAQNPLSVFTNTPTIQDSIKPSTTQSFEEADI
ncbi:hypothetical protein AX774_g1880 [Zancudomyces culisetae]|uniref:Uncharacterized protein n=1 Tax=Zancudomyces culisetae TaxID=1213189 RepID=A0A1R1PUH3_ZANCU|nr:hypothetical protein AX774_g1880 [Zancudomyces culisetae]|eukprot:OMH84597.1 hypothetical protein AX774_g1880 [Zancudomyces culisetae]